MACLLLSTKKERYTDLAARKAVLNGLLRAPGDIEKFAGCELAVRTAQVDIIGKKVIVYYQAWLQYELLKNRLDRSSVKEGTDDTPILVNGYFKYAILYPYLNEFQRITPPSPALVNIMGIMNDLSDPKRSSETFAELSKSIEGFEARIILVLCHMWEIGTKRDLKTAKEVLDSLVREGYPLALALKAQTLQQLYSTTSEGEELEARKLFKEACRDPHFMLPHHQFAEWLHDFENPKLIEEAREHYLKAAEGGINHAWRSLGTTYEGSTDPNDIKKKDEYYRKYNETPYSKVRPYSLPSAMPIEELTALQISANASGSPYLHLTCAKILICSNDFVSATDLMNAIRHYLYGIVGSSGNDVFLFYLLMSLIEKGLKLSLSFNPFDIILKLVKAENTYPQLALFLGKIFSGMTGAYTDRNLAIEYLNTARSQERLEINIKANIELYQLLKLREPRQAANLLTEILSFIKENDQSIASGYLKSYTQLKDSIRQYALCLPEAAANVLAEYAFDVEQATGYTPAYTRLRTTATTLDRLESATPTAATTSAPAASSGSNTAP